MYFPTINISSALITRLGSGAVTLLPGQWVKLDWSDRKARYIGVTPHGTFVIQHHEGNYCPKKFKALVNYWRGACNKS